MITAKRSRIVLAGLAVVSLGAAAAWWLWPAKKGASAPSAASRKAQPPPSKEPAAELVLQVNGGTSVQVPAGSAVFFTVSLTGSASGSGLRVGAAGRPWTADLRFETGDTGQPLPWRIERLGQPLTLRFPGDPQTTPSSTTQTDEAIVDGSSVHQIELGVSPDEATRIASGTYAVRAVLPLPRNSSGETRLVSNTVTLVVEGVESAAQPSLAAEKTRLEAAARFHLRSEKWEDAHRIALQLVQRESADALAYLLLGDALNGLQRDDEALAAYREALAELPKTVDESPDYVIARMAQVEQRLETAKRGIQKQ